MSLFPSYANYDLKHPVTKEPTGFVFQLTNPAHDDDALRAAHGVLKSMKKDPNSENFDLAMDNRITSLLACIKGWTNSNAEFAEVFKKLGFSDDSYSPDKAKALLTMKTAGWIRNQLDAAILDDKSFFTNA